MRWWAWAWFFEMEEFVAAGEDCPIVGFRLRW